MSEPESNTPAKIAVAYAVCRAIAKREAKNFYYAFRILPAHKSDAMCAVYAFMRRADDLADDESLSIAARREAMDAWTAAWRATRSEGTADPVFLALADTQRRFGIPDALLEQLVAGTTLDLQATHEGIANVSLDTGMEQGTGSREFQVYETYGGLYRYCYLVASVVGLVCIRIFGYADPRAELYAEHTGIAFQLTNILRDVREDAERGRIYLPLDEMAATGVTLKALVEAARSGSASTEVPGLLRREIGRAEQLYEEAERLIPLLDADSRAAMRVLVHIYRALLERIAANPSAVFRKRVSVPTWQKLWILFVAGLQAAWVRRRA